MSRGPDVPSLLLGLWMPAWLTSIEPAHCVIPPTAFSADLDAARHHGCTAFIVRTYPNQSTKMQRNYQPPPDPPFLAPAAATAIGNAGIEHLLVDFPSIDPLDDREMLAHRAFFGISSDRPNPRRQRCTITELIYVPNELKDGLYLLQIQTPRWRLEAVPSRPLAVPATAEDLGDD